MFENFEIKGAEGFLTIRDKNTKEILVSKKNAIHYGNLSYAISQALSGSALGHITFLAFGNGGTVINNSGQVFYKSPNTGLSYDEDSALYNVTYAKNVSSTIVVETSASNYTDFRVTANLTFGEPGGQDVLDDTTDNNGDYVFDELALYTGTISPLIGSDGVLLTHAIFHPVQKSANREIEVDYVVRIQMGS